MGHTIEDLIDDEDDFELAAMFFSEYVEDESHVGEHAFTRLYWNREMGHFDVHRR